MECGPFRTGNRIQIKEYLLALVPKVPLVVSNLLRLQQFDQFIFEFLSIMMPGLILYVPFHTVAAIATYREGRIAELPIKFRHVVL